MSSFAPAETDYLIIGAGVMGLAFADEIFTHTDAHIMLVDKRHAPGGHWNDAYPFVKLHQPSVFYGVESRELGEYRIDESGPNAGFLSLAEGPEVLHYLHSLVRERFLPSGRIRFVPNCEVEPDGTLHHLLSHERKKVRVRRKIVNAGYLTNQIPKTHVRKFSVAEGVTCVPPNDLPRLAPQFQRYTVIGAGKTGIDACCWLLANGAPADTIRWIVPRDAWFLNRATAQPMPEMLADALGFSACVREALGSARDAVDFAHRIEAEGGWLRLDPNVEPTMYHAATVSVGELEELRRIEDVVRKGRVRAIAADRLVMDGGDVPAAADTLYIDCSAAALARPEPVKVFDGDRITLQMIRFPQLPFSAAFAGFLEAAFEADDEKNAFAAPMRISDTVEEFIAVHVPDTQNRMACSRHPAVREWIAQSRTDGFTKLMRSIDPNDAEKQAVLQRLREAGALAAANLPNLLAAIGR